MPRKTTRREKAASKRKRGRPSRIDEKVTAAICAAIERGVSFKSACEASGIPENTGHVWMRRGEDAKRGDEPFSQFFQAVTRARAKCEIRLVDLATVDGAAGARWMLERRFHREYSLKQKLEHSGPDGGPIRIDKPVAEMSEDELLQIANAGNGA